MIRAFRSSWLLLPFGALFAQSASPPSSLSVLSATRSSVQLSWTAPSPAPSGYIVERKLLGGSFAALPGAAITTATAIDNTVDAFATYVYRVRSSGLTGSSDPTAEVTVGPPPSGYSFAVPSPSTEDIHYDGWGQQLRMVLDANGDPALSYVFTDPNNDNDYLDSVLYFVSWSRAKYAWNAPVKVATVGDITVSNPEFNVGLARDARNNTLGLAYLVDEGDGKPSRIDVAFSTDGGATWKAQRAVTDSVNHLAEVSLGMNGGQIYLAYLRPYDGLRFVSGAQTDDPAKWASKLLALPAGKEGTPRRIQRIAIDDAGNPGIAFWIEDDPAYNSTLAFWRPSYDVPVVVSGTNGVQNDFVGVDLIFQGTQPRIAFYAERDDTSSLVWVSRSADGGATWAPAANVPQDGGQATGGYISLAINSAGQGALVSEVLGGNLDGTKCGLPKLSRSTDLIQWTTCSPPAEEALRLDPARPRAAYAGDDRLYLMFVNDADTDRKNGILVWREPQPAK